MYPLTIAMVVSTPALWEEAQAICQQLPVRVVLEMAAVDDAVTFLEKIDRFKPEVILLDPSRIMDGLPEIIKQVKETATAPSIVILRQTADPQEILSAIRAGASEYVFPPLATNLKEALERISHQRHESTSTASAKGGKTIGFLSVKGGCGATTIACHAAVDIARMTGKETLLADLDFASGMVRAYMQARSRYSVLDAVNNVQRLDASYWRGLVSNGFQGVEVLAGTPADVIREMPHLHDIRHLLRFCRNQYPWVVADLGHGLEPHTAAALEEMDVIVLVSTMEMPALQQTKTLLRYLKELGVAKDKIRFVLNRMPRRGDIGPGDIENTLSTQVFGVVPNDYRALELAYSNGHLLGEDHVLRHAIVRIAAQLANVQPDDQQKKKKFSLFGFA